MFPCHRLLSILGEMAKISSNDQILQSVREQFLDVPVLRITTVCGCVEDRFSRQNLAADFGAVRSAL